MPLGFARKADSHSPLARAMVSLLDNESWVRFRRTNARPFLWRKIITLYSVLYIVIKNSKLCEIRLASTFCRRVVATQGRDPIHEKRFVLGIISGTHERRRGSSPTRSRSHLSPKTKSKEERCIIRVVHRSIGFGAFCQAFYCNSEVLSLSYCNYCYYRSDSIILPIHAAFFTSQDHS